jgi:hypothetical protein
MNMLFALEVAHAIIFQSHQLSANHHRLLDLVNVIFRSNMDVLLSDLDHLLTHNGIRYMNN